MCIVMGFFDTLKAMFGGGGADPHYYDKLFGLAPGETITASSGGHFVEGLGHPTVTLGRTYLFAITTHNRLVVGDMTNSALAQPFTPGSVQIIDRGFLDQIGGFLGDRSAVTRANPLGAMERVKVLAFAPQGAPPFAITVVDSLVVQVLAFTSR
jgi:hypothetical protein